MSIKVNQYSLPTDPEGNLNPCQKATGYRQGFARGLPIPSDAQ